jgi:glycosyltransferase involved in cell wall biosynthesis
MRIALVTRMDARSPSSWSGIPNSIYRALVRNGHDVSLAAAPASSVRFQALRQWERLRNSVTRAKSLTWLSPGALRSLSRAVAKAIAEIDADVVLALDIAPIAAFRSDTPIVLWNDACFAGMVGYYPQYAHLSATSIRWGHAATTAALAACTQVVYASDWAAAEAARAYQIPPRRLHVVPFGANLENPPSRAEAQIALDDRDPSPCRLLLVGVDWERKGVDVAVEATRLVRMAGVLAELHIVGCQPPDQARLPDWVTVHGTLEKTDPLSWALLRRLYSESHFFILPTRAECFGVVFAEAAAFALPSLAPATGGVPSAVIDGVNGRLLPEGAPPHEYANAILSTFCDERRYRDLCASARIDYETRLNWDVSVRRVLDLATVIN